MSDRFAFTITDVFVLPSRGTVVFGTIESGTVRDGDAVELRDGDRVVATATAKVAPIRKRDADPASVALVLGDVAAELIRPGQRVVSRAS